MKKQQTLDINNYDHIIQRLQKVLGSALFQNNPKLSWNVMRGRENEGTLLEMSGVEIPVDSLDWFRNRLMGKFQFKFVDTPKGNKKLYILDVDCDVAIRNLRQQNHTMSPQDRAFVNRTFLSAPKPSTALKYILCQAVDQFVEHIEKEIHQQEGIKFTPEMRADCKRRVTQVFNQEYSAGTMDNYDAPESLIVFFEPVKNAIIADYRANHSRTSL